MAEILGAAVYIHFPFWGQFWIGVAAVFILYLLILVAGRGKPGVLMVGDDGQLSTSKFQFVVWTAIAVFSFVFLYAVRIWPGGYWGAVDGFPQYLLIAMGLSVTTATAAKAITVSYVRLGRVTKSGAARVTPALYQLVTDDAGQPDLSKIQMLTWTIIAVVVYVVRVFSVASSYSGCTADTCLMPDIDGPLMVLMGLSQGAYLGLKLTVDQTVGSQSAPAAAPVNAPPAPPAPAVAPAVPPQPRIAAQAPVNAPPPVP